MAGLVSRNAVPLRIIASFWEDQMPELVSNCERCGGTGLLYWGQTKWKTKHYVPCPQCRPDEEQKHPHRQTVIFGDGVEQSPRG